MSHRSLPILAVLVRAAALGLVASLAVNVGPSAAAPHPATSAANPAEAARARQFVELFLQGDDEATAKLLDDKMRSVIQPAQSGQIRAGLEAQLGAYEKVLEPWLEAAEHAGFRRYRVPVAFANGEMDFRVTLDLDSRVAGFFLVPHEPPPTAAPDPPAGVREKAVSIGVGKRALPGTLSLPKGQGPFPAVVLVHGSGPNDRDGTVFQAKPLRDLAWGLAARGIAALRYEKRSKARPEHLVARGDALTVEHEVLADARDAVELLAKGRPEIDPERVWVVGHSLGGTLAPRIAADQETPVAGLVILAGMSLPLPEKILSQSRYLAAVDGTVDKREEEQLSTLEEGLTALRDALGGELDENADENAEPPAGHFFGAPFGYYRDLEAHDPVETAAGLDLPILVLQGERDYQVTLEDFARWQKALGEKPGACLVTYPALDHLFRAGEGKSRPEDYRQPGQVETEVVEDVAGWILERKCGE